MQNTTHYELNKPDTTDYVDISDLNENMDILDTAVYGKVDKVSGKGLSTNDYTTAEKNKVGNVPADTNTALAGKQANIQKGTITVSNVWTGTSSPYYQSVTVVGATTTANSKVDIQPASTVIAQLVEDGTNALYIENNNNTLRLYAIGEKPTIANGTVIQVCVTEVAS